MSTLTGLLEFFVAIPRAIALIAAVFLMHTWGRQTAALVASILVFAFLKFKMKDKEAGIKALSMWIALTVTICVWALAQLPPIM